MFSVRSRFRLELVHLFFVFLDCKRCRRLFLHHKRLFFPMLFGLSLYISANVYSILFLYAVFNGLSNISGSSEYKPGKDNDSPLQELAFIQPTTVDKEPKKALVPKAFFML